MSGPTGRDRRTKGWLTNKTSFSFSPRNISSNTAGKIGGVSFSFSFFFAFLVFDLEFRIPHLLATNRFKNYNVAGL